MYGRSLMCVFYWFFIYFRFTWTRNWLMPPFFVLGMFYNFNPVFQCLEHKYECTCVLLIFYFILGLLRRQLSTPTPFMPLPPPHPALNKPPHANQYWQTTSQWIRVAYATLFRSNACTNNLFIHVFLYFILILTSSYCFWCNYIFV